MKPAIVFALIGLVIAILALVVYLVGRPGPTVRNGPVPSSNFSSSALLIPSGYDAGLSQTPAT